MFKFNATDNMLINQIPITVPLTVIWVLVSVFAFTAFVYHNKTDVLSKCSLISITLLSCLKKLMTIIGIQNTKTSHDATSQPKTFTRGFSMISAWFSATPDSKDDDEETQQISQETQRYSFPGLPSNFHSKRFTKNTSCRTKTDFQTDLLARQADSAENRSKKRVMVSYTILTRKLRELKRNIRENCGELDFSDVQAMSPIKKING